MKAQMLSRLDSRLGENRKPNAIGADKFVPQGQRENSPAF
jgi:hypothetical protein